MKDNLRIFLAILFILACISLPFMIAIFWSNAEAPAQEPYSDSEIRAELELLRNDLRGLTIEINRIEILIDEYVYSVNSQLSTIQTDFNKIWDSYNSLFDYVMRLEAQR